MPYDKGLGISELDASQVTLNFLLLTQACTSSISEFDLEMFFSDSEMHTIYFLVILLY